ncbi:hypothetical protein ACRN9A_05900 [Shewanella frigidimarina]|uniref:hypothetical protein n=1 Tax=Shewanella frigidimarina TaxID=56812 RepID=UPI003D7B7AA1
MVKYKSAFLIVLYSCDIVDSQTIRTLISSKVLFLKSKLVIWNNGPNNIDLARFNELIEKGLDVELRQTVNNISLAKIYNEFLDSGDSENYIILDHDTSLNDTYLASVAEFKNEIAVPDVFSKEKLHSPRFVKKLFCSDVEVTAIGSGLVVSNLLISKLKSKYDLAFDERFLLYGVDTSFFYRVAAIIDIERELIRLPKLEHSLSSDEVESVETSEFRKVEKSFDFGLRLRYYPTVDKIFLLFILCFKSITLKSPLSVKYILLALITGKHYRL